MVAVVLGGFLLLSATQVFGQISSASPAQVDSDTFLRSSLKKAKTIPKNIWDRINDARQWVWEEYPDQVLVQEEPHIKWSRYLSAALNTPDWLDLAGAIRLRREGFDHPFGAGQDGSTWQ